MTPASSLGLRVRRYLSGFRGFQPDARRFLVAALLAGAAISLFYIDFNLYLVALGFDTPAIGLIATVGSAAGLVTAFPASRLSDLVGRRAVLIWSGGVAAASLLGMVVLTGAVALVLLVFVWNVALTAFFVVQNPFLVEHSTPADRNELFSVAFAIENVTNVVAAVVGGALATALAVWFGLDPKGPEPFRFLLVGMALLTALGTVALFRIADDHPAGRPLSLRGRSLRSLRPRLPGIAGDRGTFVRLLVPTFLIGIGAGQVIPFLNLYIERTFGLDIASLNAVFAVTSLGSIGAVLAQPLIARRLGKVGSVVLVQGLSIPFLVVLGFSPIFWTVVIAMAIRASLMNAGNPIQNAFAMEAAHPDDRATLSAAQSVVWSLAWVIGGPWYSFTQATFGFAGGYRVGFVTIVVLYVTAIALYWRWFHGLERRMTAAATTGPTG